MFFFSKKRRPTEFIGVPGGWKRFIRESVCVAGFGRLTPATALALGTRHRHYRLPEERPIIG